MESSCNEPNSEDAMRGTAELLVDVAIKAFMQMHSIDRETAQRWMLSRLVAMIEENKPES